MIDSPPCPFCAELYEYAGTLYTKDTLKTKATAGLSGDATDAVLKVIDAREPTYKCERSTGPCGGVLEFFEGCPVVK